MKIVAKEGQVVLSGYVGTVDKKTDSLVAVSIANRKGKEETEWTNVAFTNPQGTGQKLADLAEKYIEVGQHITVLCNKRQNGDYENFYVVACELGPKKKAS